MSNYCIKKEEDWYVIYEGETAVTTPGGIRVTTLYKPLAERILEDLNKYGYSYRSASSILAWHFTMLDNFERLGDQRVISILSQSFLSHPDWTCVQRYSANWQSTFGIWGERAKQISQWFKKATLMQLTAICCIGNAYESVNIALELAKTMERYPAGEERDIRIGAIADMIYETMQFGARNDIINDFKTFELYYGIHLDEDGPVLGNIIENGDDIDTDEEVSLDVDNLTEFDVTIEQLVGRNFYHYTDCKKDESQPAAYAFSDLEIVETEDNEWDYDEEDEDESDDGEGENVDGLTEYLPDDCWVKRFTDNDDSNTRYLLYLVVGEDGKIEDSGCIKEISQRMGGAIFMMPGSELPSVKFYDYISYPPDNVINDLRLLFAGHCLPLNFSFVGKRLPQKMIDAGGNGGCTYALKSAYRFAYMHMSVDATEEDIIEGFDYSTYQSTGSEYGDMFTRPISYSDRCEEAMDMLLYIYDKYTDEELAQV